MNGLHRPDGRTTDNVACNVVISQGLEKIEMLIPQPLRPSKIKVREQTDL